MQHYGLSALAAALQLEKATFIPAREVAVGTRHVVCAASLASALAPGWAMLLSTKAVYSAAANKTMEAFMVGQLLRQRVTIGM